MSKRKNPEREYEVRVREIHELIYTVRATSSQEAADNIADDDSPTTVDAHVDEVLSIREVGS